GKASIIEITINKDDVTGFAKVQQIYPAGFTVEPIETKGATFSFKDNKIKFIWMALPAEKEFTISYKITPNQNTSGDFTLGGKFSFISESERKNLIIPEANFSVVEEAVVAEVITEESVVENSVVEEEVVEEIPIEEPTVLKIASISCLRTIENVGNGKYKVTVEINKNGIEGFAKITEKIPEGFTVSEGETKGGIFSVKENEAKILWMAIPKGDSYTITYNMSAGLNAKNGTYEIKGNYAYLEDDVTSKYTIDGSSFEYKIEELTAEEAVTETPIVEEEHVVEVETVTENESVPEVLVVEEEPIVEEIPVAAVTSTPSPDNGVTYKIQVGAGHKTVSKKYFANKFNLQDNVSTMNHEGWIKYLVGSYNEYKQARDKRNTVRNNVKTAFVTAYNSGTRITVQEALMISTQKWYK
ncbi:MAG: hypothetical protein JKY30_03120, partial [Flavobacteriales bacterium]|nr:hypothetical protein [Flavobacteriales bacterium]